MTVRQGGARSKGSPHSPGPPISQTQVGNCSVLFEDTLDKTGIHCFSSRATGRQLTDEERAFRWKINGQSSRSLFGNRGGYARADTWGYGDRGEDRSSSIKDKGVEGEEMGVRSTIEDLYDECNNSYVITTRLNGTRKLFAYQVTRVGTWIRIAHHRPGRVITYEHVVT